MPQDIFISYSSKDREKAEQLIESLSSSGLSIWIDRSGISAASQWSSEIVKAIEDCKIFVILLSESSLASQNVVNELLLAAEAGKQLVPIDLEPVILTHQVKYQLAGLQRVPFDQTSIIQDAIVRLLHEQLHPNSEIIERHRHLLAIVFTDIKGYSQIMNTNEELALEILNFHDAFLREKIEGSEGRVVEIIGDAFLATFESTVHAMEAAIAIQDGLAKYNDNRAEHERFQVRIGVHMGDIIEEAKGIKGDAVNIAARIQSIAPPGSVAFSETVYEAIRHKLPIDVISLGPQKLKNIQDQYTIYTLVNASNPIVNVTSNGSASNASATHEQSIHRLAVLPFEDLSPSHDNDWFADGMMDELINTLGSLSTLIVPGRSSVMVYKKDRPRASEIGEELEVRYIVEGTVRKAGEKIRISASLTDTKTNSQLWNNKFDGTFDNIFDFQERVAREITEGLKLQLTPQDQKKMEQKLTQNTEAYELYTKAEKYFSRLSKQDLYYALDCLNEAVKIDPEFAQAYVSIARTHTTLFRNYERTDTHSRLALEAIDKAKKIDPEVPIMFGAISTLYLKHGRMDEALSAAKKEIELAPTNPDAHDQLAHLYMELQMHKEAAQSYEQALLLNPVSLKLHWNLCNAYDILGDKEMCIKSSLRALPYFERHLKKNPDDQIFKTDYAGILNFLGRTDDSMLIIEDLISSPNADGVSLYNGACIIARHGNIQRAFEVLEKAVEVGFGDVEDMLTDPDLAEVIKLPEFKELRKKLGEKAIS